MVMEYLSYRPMISYSQKYNIAKILLKKHREKIELIDRKKRNVERDYGYDLDMLDFILTNAYAKNDLDSYYNPPTSRKKIKAWKLEKALRNFKSFMDDIVIETFEMKELF